MRASQRYRKFALRTEYFENYFFLALLTNGTNVILKFVLLVVGRYFKRSYCWSSFDSAQMKFIMLTMQLQLHWLRYVEVSPICSNTNKHTLSQKYCIRFVPTVLKQNLPINIPMLPFFNDLWERKPLWTI